MKDEIKNQNGDLRDESQGGFFVYGHKSKNY